jgi:hypothetical protein
LWYFEDPTIREVLSEKNHNRVQIASIRRRLNPHAQRMIISLLENQITIKRQEMGWHRTIPESLKAKAGRIA